MFNIFLSGQMNPSQESFFADPVHMQRLQSLNIDFALANTSLKGLTQTELYLDLWNKQNKLYQALHNQLCQLNILPSSYAVSQGFGLSLRYKALRAFGYRADIDFQVRFGGDAFLRQALAALNVGPIGFDEKARRFVPLSRDEADSLVYDNKIDKLYLATFVQDLNISRDLNNQLIKYEAPPLLQWEKWYYTLSVEVAFGYGNIDNQTLVAGFIPYNEYWVQSPELEIVILIWRIRELILIGSLRPRILFDFLHMCQQEVNFEKTLGYLDKFKLMSFAQSVATELQPLQTDFPLPFLESVLKSTKPQALDLDPPFQVFTESLEAHL
ncbi:MAG: hypothetical protein ACRCYY_13355 [Trueperaceae bacterium]